MTDLAHSTFAFRWLAAARRLWPAVLVIPLVVALGTGVRSASDVSQTTRFLVTDNGATLSAAGLKPDDFTRALSFKSAVQSIDSAQTEARLHEEVGARVSTEVAVDEVQKLITVVVRGATTEQVVDARALLLKTAASARRADAEAIMTSAKSAVLARATAAKERIDAIDAALTSLAPTSVALADSLRVERTKRSDDLVDAAGEQQAIDAWVAAAPETVRELPIGVASRPSRGLGLILGLMGGLALAAALVALAATLDSRVRTADEVEALCDRPVIAVLRVKSMNADLPAARLAAERVARGTIALLPIDHRSSALGAAERLAASEGDLAVRLEVLEPLSVTTETLRRAQTTPVVLVLTAGKSQRTAVERGTRWITRAGCDFAGVILVDG